MVGFGERNRLKHQLAERLGSYFAQVPGASPEEFLLEAVRKEIAFRENTLNGGRPWHAPAGGPTQHASAFRPLPQQTLPPEAIHGWLCRRLARLPRRRRSRRSSGARWFW
jgi:hypothetical protein